MQGVTRSRRVFSNLTVYSYTDFFVLEPLDRQNIRKPKALQIQRNGLGMREIDEIPTSSPNRIVQCLGLVGVVTLQNGYYLVLITQSNLVGTIAGHDIFAVSRVMFLPFATSNRQLSERQKKNESTYISILENLLEDKHFYFSYSLDITTSLKNVHNRPKGDFETSILYKMASNRYVWNYKMLNLFREFAVSWDRWFLPIMRGYIYISVYMIQGIPLDFVLISRRSRYRAGTRYRTRGVDSSGRVANYVESEQLIGVNQSWTSFLQTRGSIPVFWSQKTNLKYTPKTNITHTIKETEMAFRDHFKGEILNHSHQLIVNLLDEKGQELQLTNLYRYYLERQFDTFGHCPLDYVGFDFHAECSNGQYEKVQDLLAQLKHKLDFIGVTHVQNGALEALQYGTIRTNCLDCLDRTNLVQSTFARHSFEAQLSSIGIRAFNSSDGIIDRSFKEAWANNGDAISLQYAGTGALKSDFTRTGKRNTKGKLKDGVNAISRYVINNFHDELRQIAIDLVVGNRRVESIDIAHIEANQKNTELNLQDFDIDVDMTELE